MLFLPDLLQVLQVLNPKLFIVGDMVMKHVLFDEEVGGNIKIKGLTPFNVPCEGRGGDVKYL